MFIDVQQAHYTFKGLRGRAVPPAYYCEGKGKASVG